MRTLVAKTAVSISVLLVVAAGCGGDDDAETSTAGGGLGEALGQTTSSSQPEVVVRTTTTEAGDDDTDAATRPVPELPPPAIPAESSPPTTAPDQEPIGWPIGFGDGEELPLYGDIVVDLEQDGYLDLPAHIEAGRQVAVVSGADDGILTRIEIWLPDGTFHGSWDGGEPGVVNGWEWVADGDLVPQTGTYVFRVIHTGGSHEPFLLRFYGR